MVVTAHDAFVRSTLALLSVTVANNTALGTPRQVLASLHCDWSPRPSRVWLSSPRPACGAWRVSNAVAEGHTLTYFCNLHDRQHPQHVQCACVWQLRCVGPLLNRVPSTLRAQVGVLHGGCVCRSWMLRNVTGWRAGCDRVSHHCRAVHLGAGVHGREQQSCKRYVHPGPPSPLTPGQKVWLHNAAR